jgi:catechol 2,3-dioxygenase-like lactoylglutathione lyase family enzyme
MSTPLLGLRTVIYPAPDLGAAARWWTDFLGITPHFDEPFYVGFSPGGYEFGLLPDENPDDGALVYWGVQDVESAVAAACRLAAVEHTVVSDVGDRIITVSVRTPDGAVVGFIHNPHFGRV